MQEICIKPEYQCYAIWVYNENGELIDNKIPEELKNNGVICDLLEDIQNEFDGLYRNSSTDFTYQGFESILQKQKFIQKVEKVCDLINKEVGNKYIVKNYLNKIRL